jgi:hypothetical protein
MTVIKYVLCLKRRREGFEWQMETRICSWHFPHGKEHGHTRFA